MGGMKDLLGDEPYDIHRAREARDEGMAKTTVKQESLKWKEEFLHRIRALRRGYEGTAEEIRRHVCMTMPPGSPNTIGATINAAVKHGLLEWTGRMQSPQSVKSHARKIQVWRRR